MLATEASMSANSGGPQAASQVHFYADDPDTHVTEDAYTSDFGDVDIQYHRGAKKNRITQEPCSDAPDTSEAAVPAPKGDLGRSASSAQPSNNEASQLAILPPP